MRLIMQVTVRTRMRIMTNDARMVGISLFELCTYIHANTYSKAYTMRTSECHTNRRKKKNDSNALIPVKHTSPEAISVSLWGAITGNTFASMSVTMRAEDYDSVA